MGFNSAFKELNVYKLNLSLYRYLSSVFPILSDLNQGAVLLPLV